MAANTNSIVTSFPVEIIEIIVNFLDFRDVVEAAAHLPTLWRMVIEKSPWIRKLMGDAALYFSRKISSNSCFFRHEVSDGTLLVHKSNGNAPDGFIFVPNSYKMPIRVLDATTRTVKYTATTKERQGRGYIALRDFNIVSVCSAVVYECDGTELWAYVAGCRKLGTEDEEKAKKEGAQEQEDSRADDN